MYILNVDELLKTYSLLELLDLLPCGASITTGLSCQETKYNPIAMTFLRLTDQGSFCHSGESLPSMEILCAGKKLATKDFPMQQALQKSEEIHSDELEFLWSDGVRKYALLHAKPIYYDGVITSILTLWQDITEEKEREINLTHQNTKLQHKVNKQYLRLKSSIQSVKEIFHRINHGVFAVNDTLHFVYLNKEAQRLMKRTKEQLIGKHIMNFYDDANLDDNQRAYIEAITNNQPFRGELSGFSSDLLYEVRVYPSKRGTYVYFQDVTHRRQAEEQQKERNLLLNNQLYNRSSFLNNLIINTYQLDYVSQQLLEFGINPTNSYCCYIINIVDDHPDNLKKQPSTKTTQAMLVLLWLFEKIDNWVWKHGDEIVYLAPIRENNILTKENQIQLAHHLIQEIERQFPHVTARIGLSSVSDTPLNIRDLFEKAHRSLLIAKTENHQVHHYQDIGFAEVAFQLLKDTHIFDIIKKTLGRLIDSSQEKEGYLLTTLEQILKYDNLRITSKHLFVHYNTVIWRKQRIEKLLEMSLDDPETKSMLRLYIKVWRLYHSQSKLAPPLPCE